MSILEIKQFPEQILCRHSKPINKVTDKELALFQDMLATMHSFQGIGLAAPQIGVERRLIVVDIGEGPLKLANPEIISVKGKEKMEEGCLSVPGALVNVPRPSEVTIKALNEQGQTLELKAKGLLVRVLLHEIDHLNGKLIVDYMNLLKKLQFKLKHKAK